MRRLLPGFLGVLACGSTATLPEVSVETTTPPSSSTAAPAPSSAPVPSAPVATACAGKSGLAGDRTITVQGHTIDLHVPTSYDASKPMPLVLALHGYMMESKEMRSTTHLDEAADAKGFIVAFPNGKNESWNGGDCCGEASSNKEDDVALAKAIVSAIGDDYCIDAKRTYATGFSNGGFLSYRLACEASDVFAAIAPVSAVIGIDPDDCKPARPVPVLEIHGTSDVVVPYKGGRSVFVGPEYRSVDTTMKLWASRDACGAKTTISQQGNVTCESWKPCGGGADVELCTVDGGAHAWPGGSGSNGSDSAWKATEAVTSFLLAH